MLPEVGATEYLVIAIVALIVIGPKDLPILMRRMGQFVAKLRGMASEFRSSFDEMARQSELDDLRKEVEAMRRGQFGDTTDYNHEMRSTISDIESSMSDVGVQLHPPMSYQYDTTEAPPPPLQIAEAPAPVKKPRAKKAAAAASAAKPPAAKKAAPKAKAPTVEGGPKPRKRVSKTVEGGA
ncbi:MAG: Sec-independent protein translocase protein TatB [Alphaproteobacteria bacterium]|nr:Sec-independent protein translocase protein TatB [Alphaproteobacteria bacterium]MBU1513962.1 Sec-independent protein translocase protein TatB [Alphaproteobacteria bacterium]MBU2093098.1 Sec-independent protein translocase protein TatB [Alphaproteobacteria bacterium]MBU2151699.1 Sec-independent protein translocase protein TatB [Alphaproteobacteria bacterium]MBU2309481.1 Sec-independent protein translocase protein TatB [Alphaproteobacteria bacterium]